jgi:branched-chain amino acid transport system substrate-binding protein
MANFRRSRYGAKLPCGLWIACVLAVLPVAWAEPLAKGADIRIGMVNAQTGPAAALGQGMLAGANAVFQQVNAKGGVHGHKLRLLVGDDAYEPEQTVDETLNLVQDEKVLALFGYVGTPTVNAVLPLIRELDVPLIGVFSGALSLRQPLIRQVFNVRASYRDETEALVAKLMQKGAKKIAVVYQNDGFGLAVLSGIDSALLKRGVVVQSTGNFQRNTVAIRMALGTMLEQEPDAVVLAGPYVPVAAFIKQARAKGLKSQFATVSFVGAESLLALLESDGEGVLISQVVPPPGDAAVSIASECRADLKRLSDQPMTFVSFEGCISAKLLVFALEKVGPQPTRQALVASLESMHTVDLGGLKISFSAEDHQASDMVYLTEIISGKIVKLP